jgi:hypothetical protein
MTQEKMPDLHLGFARLTFTDRDRKVFIGVALVGWVLMAAGVVNGLVTADVHKLLTSAGMLIVFSTFLVDRFGLRIFIAQPDSTAERVLKGIQLFGLLILATGWAYRFLY